MSNFQAEMVNKDQYPQLLISLKKNVFQQVQKVQESNRSQEDNKDNKIKLKIWYLVHINS